MDAQETVEAVEAAIEVVDNAQQVVRNNPLLIAGAAALGIVAGGVGGYYFAKKKLELKYAQIADQEIAEAKEFYSRTNKTGDYETPESAAKKLGIEVEDAPEEEEAVLKNAVKSFTNYQGMFPVPKGEAPVETEEELLVEETVAVVEAEVVNVFAPESAEDEWDYETEISKRTEDAPYIIHVDEFNAAEQDYVQSSLAYYVADDVLADERDLPIEEVDSTVGEDNLKFGYGSKDNNMVYVRNDRIQVDFEIVRSKGSYAQEVLGYTDKHLEHSSSRKKMRWDDDD